MRKLKLFQCSKIPSILAYIGYVQDISGPTIRFHDFLPPPHQWGVSALELVSHNFDIVTWFSAGSNRRDKTWKIRVQDGHLLHSWRPSELPHVVTRLARKGQLTSNMGLCNCDRNPYTRGSCKRSIGMRPKWFKKPVNSAGVRTPLWRQTWPHLRISRDRDEEVTRGARPLQKTNLNGS